MKQDEVNIQRAAGRMMTLAHRRMLRGIAERLAALFSYSFSHLIFDSRQSESNNGFRINILSEL